MNQNKYATVVVVDTTNSQYYTSVKFKNKDFPTKFL